MPFPGRKFPFCTQKQMSVVLKSEKLKNGPLLILLLFFLPFSIFPNFPPSVSRPFFPSFLLHFPFSSLFPVGHQQFRVRSVWGNSAQWRNRRGGGGQGGRGTGGQGGRGGRVPPETSDQEIFDDVSRKKRQGKNGNKKIRKGVRKGGKLEMEAGKTF